MKLNNTQQKVFDILVESGTKLVNEQIANRFYPEEWKHAGNNYMGRILSELINFGLVKSRSVVIKGKKTQHHEYWNSTDDATTLLNSKKGLDIDPGTQSAEKRLTDILELKIEGLVQVEKPCPVCGSYYQRNGRCNKC